VSFVAAAEDDKQIPKMGNSTSSTLERGCFDGTGNAKSDPAPNVRRCHVDREENSYDSPHTIIHCVVGRGGDAAVGLLLGCYRAHLHGRTV